jgi:GABA(A) receptor-associated protein
MLTKKKFEPEFIKKFNSLNYDTILKDFYSIKKKFPDKIPIIIDRATNYTPVIDKNKYLVPFDSTISQLIFVIRKRINLSPDQALYLFVNDTIPKSTSLIGDIYSDHKQSNGFLYLLYSIENTFG